MEYSKHEAGKMIIGIPKEVEDHEYRVALTPGGANSLTREGHQVLVQLGAGVGSGFPDEEYAHGGAQLVKEPKDIFAAADMIVKVKEPLESEYSLLRPGLILFTFLHLAAVPRLARELLERKVAAIAYETVQPAEGNLPLLTPMSEVAGRLSIQNSPVAAGPLASFSTALCPATLVSTSESQPRLPPSHSRVPRDLSSATSMVRDWIAFTSSRIER